MSDSFIHRYAAGTSATTLLLLHGTGGDENDLLSLGQTLAPAANFLSPRGRVLENGMPRFFRRLAEGVFDLDDLKLRTRELAEFVDSAAAQYGFAREKVIPVGYSNGANIAASMLLGGHPFPAAILFRAMVPFVPEQLPALHNTRVFLSAGKADPIIPPANVSQLIALFEQAGAPVTQHFMNAGHELTAGDIELARQWLVAIHQA